MCKDKREALSADIEAYLAQGNTVTVVPPKQRRKRASNAKVGHWERAKIKRASTVDDTKEALPVSPGKSASVIRCTSPGHARQVAGSLTETGARVRIKGTSVHVIERPSGSRSAEHRAAEARAQREFERKKAEAQLSGDLKHLL